MQPYCCSFIIVAVLDTSKCYCKLLLLVVGPWVHDASHVVLINLLNDVDNNVTILKYVL